MGPRQLTEVVKLQQKKRKIHSIIASDILSPPANMGFTCHLKHVLRLLEPIYCVGRCESCLFKANERVYNHERRLDANPKARKPKSNDEDWVFERRRK